MGELWAPVTAVIGLTAEMDRLRHIPVAKLFEVDDQCFTAFTMPSDFNTIVSASLIVVPRATVAVADWDIYSNYASVGEAYDTHEQSDEGTTYDVTSNETFAVNIAPILSNVVAGDIVGISLKLANALHDVYIVGVRLEYI